MDWIFVFMNYGPEWRAYRRELHNAFVPEMMARYHPFQLQIARELLLNLLTTPADFSAHIKLCVAHSADPSGGRHADTVSVRLPPLSCASSTD